jgi:hypothetical protein
MSDDTIKEIRAVFLVNVKELNDHVKLNSRMDIRDKIAALALIDRVLAREKEDKPDAGSAIRKYAPAFQKSYGAGRGAPNTGNAEEPESDSERDDSGEHNGSGETDESAAAR